MQQQTQAALLGILEADPNVRSAAEQHLAHAAATQPGFAPSLVAIARSDGVPDSLRQSALLVLKTQVVRHHWDPAAQLFRPPECGPEDKEVVRASLPACLGDANSKVRTAAAMAVSAILQTDFPQQWPGLLEWMVASLRDTTQQGVQSNLVLGVLRCLSMVAEDLGDHLPQVVPVLLPSLLHILNTPHYPGGVRRQVITILHGVLSQLGVMQGGYQRQVRDLLAPLLDPWIPSLAAILAAPLTKAPSAWAIKLEVLKVSVAVVTYFGKAHPHRVQSLLGPCWHLFTVSGRATFQELEVQGGEADEDNDGHGDDDGEPVSLETLFSEMFELLLTLVGSPRYAKLLKPHMHDLIYTTITYMQMTAKVAEEWAESPNLYVADEDEAMLTARVGAELLLDELARSWGVPCITAILDCIERVLADAEAARAAPSSASPDGWWKLREAAINAVGCIAQAVCDGGTELGDMQALAIRPGGPKPGPAAQVIARLQALLDGMMQHDLQGPHSNPFLAGRVLWACAKMSAVMTPAQVETSLSAACAGIRGTLPPPVRIGACRALVRLLPRLDELAGGKSRGPGGGPPAAHTAHLAALLPGLYIGLVLLLGQSSDEVTHLVLETLEVVIKHDVTCIVRQYLGQVAGPVLRVWEESVADPLVGEDAQAVLAALAAHPPCHGPLVVEVLPALVHVISSPSGQRPMLVEASLNLLRALVKRRPSAPAAGDAAGDHMAAVQQIYVATAGPLLALIDTSADAGVQQEAQQVLCQMVRTGRAALLAWGGGEPEATVRRLVQSALRLLRPGVDEMDAPLAGHLVTDMLLSFPPHLMAPYTQQLLEAVVARLVTANYTPLVSGLLMVLSQLARADAPALVDALAAMTITLPGGQTAPALAAVLTVWADRAPDVHGRFYTALVTTALGRLLELQHPKLTALQVRGKRLDIGGGVRTRSQLAAAGGEQHAVATAPMKLAAALAQVLAHAQEAAELESAGRSGDAEEEEDDDEEGGDDDHDEEEDNNEGLQEHGVPAPALGQGQQAARVNGAALRLVVQGSRYTDTASLLHTLAAQGLVGDYDAWRSSMAGDDDAGDPLSPSSVLHDSDTAPGAEDAAPPGDPLLRLDLGLWVSELFQRMSMQEGGATLLQAAAHSAMTRKQAAAVQKLLHASRLRP